MNTHTTHNQFFFRGLAVAAAIFALDQWSKSWILALFSEHSAPREVFPFFHLTLVWNRGVSFGMFSGMDARFFLLLLTAGISLCVAWWLRRTQDRVTAWLLGMILGGACGNMLDRLRHGAVVDFLDVHWETLHWPTFNVADSAIVVGALLLAWRCGWRDAPPERT
jgi:signal peptidase II